MNILRILEFLDLEHEEQLIELILRAGVVLFLDILLFLETLFDHESCLIPFVNHLPEALRLLLQNRHEVVLVSEVARVDDFIDEREEALANESLVKYVLPVGCTFLILLHKRRVLLILEYNIPVLIHHDILSRHLLVIRYHRAMLDIGVRVGLRGEALLVALLSVLLVLSGFRLQVGKCIE